MGRYKTRTKRRRYSYTPSLYDSTKSSTNSLSTTTFRGSSCSTKSSSKESPEHVRGPIENLVIYYLSALQGLWSKKDNKQGGNHPQPGRRKIIENVFKETNSKTGEESLNITDKPQPEPDKYTSQNGTVIEQKRAKSDTEMSSIYGDYKLKVYNIVSKAIDYGVKQGIVRKSGKYFWFKWNNKIKHRRKGPKRRRNKRKPYRTKLRLKKKRVSRKKI